MVESLLPPWKSLLRRRDRVSRADDDRVSRADDDSTYTFTGFSKSTRFAVVCTAPISTFPQNSSK